jgi:hypothetical protein
VRRNRPESGQSTVEWTALVLLVALVLTAVLAVAGARPPGVSLATAVLERMVCAVHLSADCRSEPKLIEGHGDEIARLLRAHAPTLLYEEGMTALPVDFRRCREDGCAAGAGDGSITRSDSGEPVVAFTHAVDCRPGRAAASEPAGADCSGSRAGNIYLQYWLYYPGSATAEGSTPLKGAIRDVSKKLGKPSHHPDDWESYQVRVGPGGRSARASSHHRYSYELNGGVLIPGHRIERGPGGKLRVSRRPEIVNGWGPDMGTLYVSGGSHAGNARVNRRVSRSTGGHRLRLIPLRRIAAGDESDFAVTPPWRKRVFLDPEYEGTD